MNNSNGSPEINYGTNAETTVLDLYFAEVAKGPEHCRKRALYIWNTLMPEDKLVLQSTARSFAGNNLELSAEYARSVLLLEDVNRQAIAFNSR